MGCFYIYFASDFHEFVQGTFNKTQNAIRGAKSSKSEQSKLQKVLTLFFKHYLNIKKFEKNTEMSKK